MTTTRHKTSGDIYEELEIYIDRGAKQITLDGRALSGPERRRAKQVMAFLRELEAELNDDVASARVQCDIAELSAARLGDLNGALEAALAAFVRQPRVPYVVKAYHRAALAAQSWGDVVASLEAEARVTESSSKIAALEVERGRLLEVHLDKPEAARTAYRAALDAEPDNIPAAMALERLCAGAQDYRDAATWAEKVASGSTLPGLRVGHTLRAISYLERVSALDAAQELASGARAHSSGSPGLEFALERLAIARDDYSEIIALRDARIEAGTVEPASGWFDIGLIARYRLRDVACAVEAFRNAVEAAPETAGPALEELSDLLEQTGDTEGLLDALTRRLELEGSPQGRAALYTRIGFLRESKLDDPNAALEAYEAALAEDRGFVEALRGAGRLYYRTQSKEKLLEMHRLEAESTDTPQGERAVAMWRAGELLIENSDTLDEGIAMLHSARKSLPDNLSVFVALERALLQKESWEQLQLLYEAELGHTEERSRRAWLLEQIASIAGDRLGDRDRAIEVLKEAAEIDVSGPSTLLDKLAGLLYMENRLDELAPVLERMALSAQDPSQAASTYARLANVHEQRGAFDEAVEAYRTATEVAPESHPVYAAAGRAFLRAQRYEELVHLFEAASRRREGAERARWLHRAAEILAHHLDHRDEAIDLLRRALDSAPDHDSSLQLLSTLLRAGDHYSDLSELWSDHPSLQPSLLARAALAEAAGEDERAAQLYKQSYDSGQLLARLPYLRLAIRCGQWQQVAEDYAATDPDDARGCHERYRAAEIYAARLDDPEAALENYRAAAEHEEASIPATLAMLPLLEGEQRCDVLMSLLQQTKTCASQSAFLRMSIISHDSIGREDVAIAQRLMMVHADAGDPVGSVEAELALRRIQERSILVKLLPKIAGHAKSDPLTYAATLTRLGLVYDELGSLQESVDAFESALGATDGAMSPLALVALIRLYTRLENSDRYHHTLRSLAGQLPAGAKKASCLRVLGSDLEQMDRNDEALAAYDEALQADPRDFESLCALASLCEREGTPERLIEPLRRVFSAVSDPPIITIVGCVLAAKLIRQDRLESAREVLERVLTVDAECTRGLMLLSELDTLRESWPDVVSSLERIARSEGAATPIRIEAVRRLVALHLQVLEQRKSADETAALLDDLNDDSWESLHAQLEVQELLGNTSKAAETLVELADHPDVEEERRTSYLLHLASLQEGTLADPAAALETLSRIRAGGAHQNKVVAHLLVLAERTGRWDTAVQALEAAVKSEPSDPSWEALVRRSLAKILEERLRKPEAAVEHYQRIVELDPLDLHALERLADQIGASAPKQAIGYYRKLLSERPRRADVYAALRSLFHASGHQDGAFCAEAILQGLELADEETSYFYRQRRAQLPSKFCSKLTDKEVAALCPELDTQVFALARATDAVLAVVFPPDLAGYGSQPDTDGPMSELIANIAALFSIADYRVLYVSNQFPPTVEPGPKPTLIIPRRLADAAVREQQFVIGALISRAAFGGLIAGSGRSNPTGPREVTFVLEAACAIADPDKFKASGADNPVYADIEKRLDKALDGADRDAVIAAAKRVIEAGRQPKGEHVCSALAVASMRAGFLSAFDPAMAISALRVSGPGLTGQELDREYEIPEAAVNALPFVLSEHHLQIRERLAKESK